MYLWVDDLREPPKTGNNWLWARSVSEAKTAIMFYERQRQVDFIHIDLDHDAGDYTKDGGDYIEILNWLEETGRNYPIRIHSMNPVGVQNMRVIIQRNGWTEVK